MPDTETIKYCACLISKYNCILTVLTMTILGIENKNDFPKISYVTAIDLYIGVCFGFVMATILEFAFVHYFTKYGTGEPLTYESSDDEDSLFGETMSIFESHFLHRNGIGRMTPRPENGGSIWSEIARRVCACIHCLVSTKGYTSVKQKDMKGLINSVSQIDRGSRVMFPVVFFVFNVVYWASYARWTSVKAIQPS